MNEKKEKSDIQGRESDPNCILCGRCLEVCPLVAATGREELGPRGKMLLLDRLAKDPESLSEEDAARLASMCLTCGRCAKVCPQGVSVPETVSQVRAAHPGFTAWLWKRWIGSASLSWPLASRLGGVASRLAPAGDNRVSQALGRMASMADRSPVAAFLIAEETSACAKGKKAVLFPGCLARNVQKRWTRKAITLLKMTGADVMKMPRWDCCGGTLGHAGLSKEMHAARAHNVALWRKAGRPLVVTFCASCHASLAAYAGDDSLFESADEAELFAAALTPLSSLLADADFHTTEDAPEVVGYHQPCHAPEGDPDRALLRQAMGARLAVPDKARCCGMGGVLQLAAPELSSTVARYCWDGLGEASPKIVLTGCSGCVTQLSASAPHGVRVVHWLDAVDSRQ